MRSSMFPVSTMGIESHHDHMHHLAHLYSALRYAPILSSEMRQRELNVPTT